jgi:hypothetical protein
MPIFGRSFSYQIIPTFVICVIGAISALRGIFLPSLLCLAILVSAIHHLLREKFDSLFVIGLLVCGWITISQTLYTFGQFVSPIHPSVIILVMYTSIFIALSYSCPGFFTTNFIRIARFPIFITTTVSLIFFQRLSTIVSFLGFGYDNYGHLVFFRSILSSGHFWFGVTDSTTPSNLFAMAPSGALGALSMLAAVTGISGLQIGDSIRIFAAATIMLPISFVFVSLKIILRTENSFFRIIGSSVLVIGVVILGYPSHIWFSGYFASNFATLLVLITVGSCLSSASVKAKLWLTISLVAVTFTAYSLYSIFAAVGVIALLLGNKQQIIPELKQVSRRRWIYFLLSLSLYGLLVSVSLVGLRSSVGTGHFLVDGGIAPLPIGTTMFIFGLAGSLLSRTHPPKIGKGEAALVAQGLVITATACMVYAHYKTSQPGQPWYVPYYPTKLTIMVVLIVMVLLIDQVFPLKNTKTENFFQTLQGAFFVFASVIALVVAGHNDWPFSGGFMGTTLGVVSTFSDGLSNDDIQGNLVLDWVDASNQVDRPVLVMMDANDSELRTRWVNSLTFRWTDENWGPWMSANNFIRTGEFTEATKILFDRFLLITNQKSLVDSFQGIDDSLVVCTTPMTLSRHCDIYYSGI